MSSAQGIIFSEDASSVLLIKRRDMPVWEFPGGAIEPDESPEEAVVREVFEESGFNVKIKRKIGVYTHCKSLHSKHLYECEIVSGEPTLSSESKAVEFISTKSLPELRSPYLDFWLDEALSNVSEVLEKFLPITPKKGVFKLALKHPIVFIRYLLVKVGIHINT